VVPTLFAPFLITIVAIIAADNSHLPFSFVSAAEAQGAYSNNFVTLRDALHDITMPVLTMNDIIFPRHYGRRKSKKNGHR
jgi:hypothetical protein